MVTLVTEEMYSSLSWVAGVDSPCIDATISLLMFSRKQRDVVFKVP